MLFCKVEYIYALLLSRLFENQRIRLVVYCHHFSIGSCNCFSLRIAIIKLQGKHTNILNVSSIFVWELISLFSTFIKSLSFLLFSILSTSASFPTLGSQNFKRPNKLLVEPVEHFILLSYDLLMYYWNLLIYSLDFLTYYWSLSMHFKELPKYFWDQPMHSQDI